MTLKQVLNVTLATALVTITTCGRHGGCILKETPVYMARDDIEESYNGKLLNAKVSEIKAYNNILEIIIDKEAKE